MSLRNRGVIRIGVVARLRCSSAASRQPRPRNPAARCAFTTARSRRARRSTRNSTIATNMPFMAVFNNLVRFDPPKPRNGFDTIVPELAESWAWDTSGTKLTFKLRSGVTWHDGKPFTAKDVQCTWHRLNGREPDYLRRSASARSGGTSRGSRAPPGAGSPAAPMFSSVRRSRSLSRISVRSAASTSRCISAEIACSVLKRKCGWSCCCSVLQLGLDEPRFELRRCAARGRAIRGSRGRRGSGPTIVQ